MSKRNLAEWWQQLSDTDETSAAPKKPASKRPAHPAAKSDKLEKLQRETSSLLAQQDDQHSFTFTYQAARYEHAWLMNYLGPLYEHRWISDVLRLVKGGKEANVYLCSPGASVANKPGWRPKSTARASSAT
jgi:hypothetical protein